MNKKFFNILGIIFVVLIIVAGFVADIVFWSYSYSHRAPDQVGHGVPLFSVIGVVLGLVLCIVVCIIQTMIANKKSNNKDL